MTLHVIIPVYNGARYVSEALYSILNERARILCDLHVILVNDGSSDRSEEICKEFEKKYAGIDYLYQENMGVSSARNKGLQQVFKKCEPDDWIGFLDADDIWHMEWIEAIDRCENSDADIIGFGMTEAYDGLNGRKVLPEKQTMVGGTDTAISENRRMHFGAYLYRVRHLRNNEIFFIPGVTNGEDLIFKYCAFFSANKVEYYPSMLYVYRRNEYSVTNNLGHLALEYYEVLFRGWNGLIEWLTKREMTNGCIQMIEFAVKRINCTCMYAARNYCIWHNGSYWKFKKDIVCGLLQKNLLNPVKFEDDISLARDYKCLNDYPMLFFVRFYLQGVGDRMKRYIKKVFHLYASKQKKLFDDK